MHVVLNSGKYPFICFVVKERKNTGLFPAPPFFLQDGCVHRERAFIHSLEFFFFAQQILCDNDFVIKVETQRSLF